MLAYFGTKQMMGKWRGNSSMSEQEKENKQEIIESIAKYFEDEYTSEEIEGIIIQLMDKWKVDLE